MIPNTYYHIYNHANGDENLFRTDDNYFYFLKLWAKYIEPIAGTFAYCLMPNHFYFLVKIKDEKELNIRFNNRLSGKSDLSGFENLIGLISKQFSNLFNAYAKAYNKMYDRRGSLFIRPYKSKEVNNERYLATLVSYMHKNPIHHGFCNNIEDWQHSSYHAYLSDKSTRIKKEEILSQFLNKADFVRSHIKDEMTLDKSLFIDF